MAMAMGRAPGGPRYRWCPPSSAASASATIVRWSGPPSICRRTVRHRLPRLPRRTCPLVRDPARQRRREDRRCGDAQAVESAMKRAMKVADERGLARKPVYTAADLDGLPHLGSLPGEAPFVRGPHRSMYAGKPWTIRQYAGFADATASNLAFRQALAQGAQGLSVAFDLPTHRGYEDRKSTRLNS